MKKYSSTNQKRSFSRQDAYNRIFNHTISEKNLDLRAVTPGRVPFWYLCECSGKVDVSVTEPGVWYGVCPVCRKEFYLDVGKTYERLDSVYARMDFSAVSRNIVFAQGMGTSLSLQDPEGHHPMGYYPTRFHKNWVFICH